MDRAAGDLEKMMPLTWHFSEDGDSEMWTALACLLYSNNSLNTAAYFAQRVSFAADAILEFPFNV